MYAFVNSIVHKIADFVCWQGKYLNVKLWLSQGNFLKYETRLKHLSVGAENGQEALFNKDKGEGTCVGQWMIILKKEILTSTLANANKTVRTILSWVIQVQTLPKALQTQAFTALTSNFGSACLVQYAW